MRIAAITGCVVAGCLAGCSNFDALDRCSREPCGADAAADSAPFCERLSPKPLYCCDFDQGTYECAPNDTTAVHDTGTVAVELDASSAPPSAPGSLVIRSPAISGATSDRTALCVHFPTAVLPKTSALFAFDLLVGSIAPQPVEVSHVQFFDAKGGEQLGLDLARAPSDPQRLVASTAQQVNPPPGDALPADAPPSTLTAGRWTHLEMVLSLQQAAYTVASDDAGASAPLYPGFRGGETAEICVGLSYFNLTSPIEAGTIHVDNLVFDVR